MAKDKVASKLPLTLPEYNRIYEVIYSVLEGRANTPFACMFFATAGALILKEHYKIAARPVAGAFFLCVDPEPFGISFAKNEDGSITSDLEGFHMWVQTKAHVIDFMAPIWATTKLFHARCSSAPCLRRRSPLRICAHPATTSLFQISS